MSDWFSPGRGAPARKRFGQHFLFDQVILQKMVSAIAPQLSDRIVEIGPGRGALTEHLLAVLPHLDVVEIDRDLIPLLTGMASTEQLSVHEADILKFDVGAIATALSSQIRVVGNLPYNISTPLMFHLFSSLALIDDMHFLLQKEVADRMVAVVGSSQYGRLSVMTQFFCDVECLFDVGPEAFHPPPKVDSTFVRLQPHRRYQLSTDEFEVLRRLVSHVFTMRRKTLRKSLQSLIPLAQLGQLPVDLTLRPQELSVDQYVLLSQKITLE